MAVTVVCAARPAVANAQARRPVAVKAVANNHKAAIAAGAASFAMAIAPAAQAAQEAMLLAEGEPAIVQIGWAALAASFSMSLAMVVWGRSGL